MMMRRRPLSYALLFTAALIAALSYPAVNQARGGAPKESHSKLDRVLRKAAATGDTSSQRVIVRARAGRSASVAERLAKHGDRIEAKHQRLESLTAFVHGWAIAERIQQISDDVLQVNQGSLYPALHRLEHQGWIEAEWAVSELGRRAKYYRLTPSGRRQLAVETGEWERMCAAIGRVMKLA